MPRPDIAGFNKEKLTFLVCSTIFAVAFYLFLASAPVTLQDEKPIGAQPGPIAAAEREDTSQKDVEYYVSRPNLTRKSPFQPKSDFIKKEIKPVVNNLPPPPAPPPPPEEKKVAITKKVWDPKDLDVQVEYMGVLVMNDETYGLVKPKDGSSPRRVQEGETLTDMKYTVTKIEKQAIWMKDEEGRPFILKNSSFSGEEVATADDGDKKKAETKKAAKEKKEKPKDKPKEAPKPQPVQPAQPVDNINNNLRKRRARPGHENDAPKNNDHSNLRNGSSSNNNGRYGSTVNGGF
jgi:hypothetical protein